MENYQEGWPGEINVNEIETPAFIIDELAIKNNVAVFERIQNETGCKFLLALKSFSSTHFFPLISETFYGVAAGSLWEAQLGAEKFGKEIHVFSPAYRDEKETLTCQKIASHMTFNSFSQWNQFKNVLLSQKRETLFGIRVNPEHSEVQWPIYDPSAPKSRFGVKAQDFEKQDLTGFSGLHFHNLCELGPDCFERTLAIFEKKFGKYLEKMSWVNFGGGHNITEENYDILCLIKIIKNFQSKFPHLDIYFEPGTSVLWETGILVASVLDVVQNETAIAILDVSAVAHMPEVIELGKEYDPDIWNAEKPGELPYEFRLASNSCMTGDIIGDYSFFTPLKTGDKVIFLNMSQYTIVRMNTFCGVHLPSIYAREAGGKLNLIKKFTYKDFQNRLT